MRRKFAYEIEAETFGARGGYGANLHTKSKMELSGPEGIQRKFAYEIEAETLRVRGDTVQICIQNRCRNLQGQRGYGANLHTKSKLELSGPEGIRRKFAYEIEAETFRARGDAAQICIRNRG